MVGRARGGSGALATRAARAARLRAPLQCQIEFTSRDHAADSAASYTANELLSKYRS